MMYDTDTVLLYVGVLFSELKKAYITYVILMSTWSTAFDVQERHRQTCWSEYRGGPPN